MDLNDLEEILRKTQSCRRRLVVTDGVFSMDGDIAPLGQHHYVSRFFGFGLLILIWLLRWDKSFMRKVWCHVDDRWMSRNENLGKNGKGTDELRVWQASLSPRGKLCLTNGFQILVPGNRKPWKKFVLGILAELV